MYEIFEPYYLYNSLNIKYINDVTRYPTIGARKWKQISAFLELHVHLELVLPRHAFS